MACLRDSWRTSLPASRPHRNPSRVLRPESVSQVGPDRKGFGDGQSVAAAARARLRMSGLSCGERLVHDAADGARAMPAFRAAAQATINLRRRTRTVRPRIETGAHIAIR